MIEDDVDDDADAASVRGSDEAVEIIESAEQRVNRFVVGDVVAEIHLR